MAATTALTERSSPARRGATRSVAALACLAGIAGLAALACAGPRALLGRGPSLHLSELKSEGDAARRASLGLVIDGLEADELGQAQRAQGLYARALQIDSGNPYAYLALARHHLAEGDAQLALEQLARAEDLLSSEGAISPRVEVHLVGLRGMALLLEGRADEAKRLLAQAARAAPDVWGDAQLSPEELR